MFLKCLLVIIVIFLEVALVSSQDPISPKSKLAKKQKPKLHKQAILKNANLPDCNIREKGCVDFGGTTGKKNIYQILDIPGEFEKIAMTEFKGYHYSTNSKDCLYKIRGCLDDDIIIKAKRFVQDEHKGVDSSDFSSFMLVVADYYRDVKNNKISFCNPGTKGYQASDYIKSATVKGLVMEKELKFFVMK